MQAFGAVARGLIQHAPPQRQLSIAKFRRESLSVDAVEGKGAPAVEQGRRATSRPSGCKREQLPPSINPLAEPLALQKKGTPAGTISLFCCLGARLCV